ncbi:MAG: hypothetical protein GWP08_07045 [Nitrospiraceae bacterium]|nr:hypothetical protein [Nitrospiraceae bacterium]
MEEYLTFRNIAFAGMAATIVGSLGHRILFGANRPNSKPSKNTVRRFGIWERLVHFLTMSAFLCLAISGFIEVAESERLSGLTGILHVSMAPVLAIGLFLMLATWGKDGRFAAYDLKWSMVMGGGLGFGKHPPAGRFNAGQKAYLWAAVLLGLVCLASGLGRMYPVLGPLGQDIVYQTHRWTALTLVMATVIHLYLRTLANPGTVGVLLTGRVSPEWAEAHHPVWWDEIDKRK